MARRGDALGVDFGTSNSAAGWLSDGRPQLLTWETGRQTLPTTFFFNFETRETLIGEAANQALLEGAEGRFMRALKRVLGTTLMHETRQILNERVTFVEIIARFLRVIKDRAEATTGRRFDRVVSGRPVVFHRAGDAREAQAEEDLRACYLAAGFDDVTFLPEPEAAAIASGALEHTGEIGLIVDIGGGTSDFSVFRAEGDGVAILANHGVRIGGTDFDRTISIKRVMPLLGKGTELAKLFGPGTTPTPAAIFNDLATWELIPFLYTPANRRMAKEMARLAREPEKLRRLVTVLDQELGHELAFAVERGKIAANDGASHPQILLEEIEPGLAAPLPAEGLASSLATLARGLRTGAEETLRLAGLDPTRIDRVIYVGGSSLMAVVTEEMNRLFPDARHAFTEVFTAVADGLSLAAGRR
ncbi:MAG: Hsp70 family protein [Pseudomonadota bacterium]